MEENVVDYESIMSDCGVGVLPVNQVLSRVSGLEEFYDSEKLVEIYNYFLLNVTVPEVLCHVIKLTDSYRNQVTLKILLSTLNNNRCDDDGYINVRVMCAKAIANYKDNSTLVELLSCLNNKHENYKVRLACADALGRIGDRFAVKPLLDVVEDEEEKSVYLKESVTFALGILGDTSAIDPLISILESKQGLLDKFSFLKEKIVEALGKLNFHNKKVVKALKGSLMDSSPMVRINAIEAIMNSEDEDSVELIKPCLNDEVDEVKRNALIALYNLCGRDILDEVIELPIYTKFVKDEAQQLLDEYENGEEDG